LKDKHFNIIQISVVSLIILCFIILILRFSGIVGNDLYHGASIVMSILLCLSGIAYLMGRKFLVGAILVIVAILLFFSNF